MRCHKAVHDSWLSLRESFRRRRLSWHLAVTVSPLRLRRAALKHREGDHTDENGKQRTRRVGQSHRQKRLREQAGRQICAGDAHQKDRPEVMQERQRRLAAGAEIAAEAELDTGKEAVPDIAAQILPAGDGHRRVRREQSDPRLRRKLDSRADGLRDGDGRPHRAGPRA